MAQEAKFSINMKPRFGDEFRDSGVVHDLTYHIWSREANVAYGNHLGGLAVEGLPSPVYIESVYTSSLLMTEEAIIYFRVTKIGRTSITYETQVNEAVSGRPIATIKMVVVAVNRETGKAVPVPEENKEIMINFEGKENVEIK